MNKTISNYVKKFPESEGPGRQFEKTDIAKILNVMFYSKNSR
jgi:hypothetical protein